MDYKIHYTRISVIDFCIEKILDCLQVFVFVSIINLNNLIYISSLQEFIVPQAFLSKDYKKNFCQVWLFLHSRTLPIYYTKKNELGESLNR